MKKRNLLLVATLLCLTNTVQAETYDNYTVSGINTFANLYIKNDRVNTFTDDEKTRF